MAAISTLVDRVKIVVLSSGTGPFALGSAVPAFRGVDALVDGATYSYATESGSNFEVGTGVFVQSLSQLVRSPILSSSGGAAVAFPANIEIAFTVLAQDIVPPGALPIVQTTGTGTTVAMSQNATTEALATKVDELGARAAISATTPLEYDDVSGVMSLDTTLLPGLIAGVTVQASATITAKQFVNVYNSGGDARVRPALANDPLTFANGYAPLGIASGAAGLILMLGFNDATVAAPASEVWLSDSTPGGFVTTPPTASGSIIQPLGAAIPGVGIFFTTRERVLL